MSLIIRPATIEDLPKMYRISVAAHVAGYANFIPDEERKRFDERYVISPEGEAKFVEKMTKRIENGSWLFWVADSEGEVVGYTLAQKVNDHHLLKKGMFVDPSAQGGGVGSALFQASLEPITNGIIELSVIHNNERAKHIYEKNGFVVVGTDPETYFGATLDVMRLTKE